MIDISKTIPNPAGHNRSYFATQKESFRKDVEHAFGVLQDCFSIFRYPSQTLDQMWEVRISCVAIYNMIMESERNVALMFDDLYKCHETLVEPHQGLLTEFLNLAPFIRNLMTTLVIGNKKMI
jgi:hypothetical protein